MNKPFHTWITNTRVFLQNQSKGLLPIFILSVRAQARAMITLMIAATDLFCLPSFLPLLRSDSRGSQKKSASPLSPLFNEPPLLFLHLFLACLRAARAGVVAEQGGGEAS